MAYNPALPVGPFASRKRYRKEGFATAGKGVVITNPKAQEHLTRRVSPSLGMGAPTQERRY